MIQPDFQELGRVKFLGGFRKEIWKRAMYVGLLEQTHSTSIFLSHKNYDQRAATEKEAFDKQLFVSLSPLQPVLAHWVHGQGIHGDRNRN